MKFTPDSKFMIVCTRLVELTKINLLWLLCCFPLITLGASGAALYDSVRHCFRGSERNPISRFFQSFRRDFKASLVPTVLYLAAL